MLRKYKEIAFLTNGHTKGITAVEFNSAGTMLATGGLDGKIALWTVPLGKMLHIANGNSAITSLKWTDGNDETILFGTKDGNISTLSLTSGFAIHGFWAHRYPVEHLAINGDLVASGAQRELHVWRWDHDACAYICEAKLQGPPMSSYNEGKEILVTSLHWTTSEQHGTLLMVTYMYHGAHLIETSKWTRVRSVPFPGKIAHASLSENGMLVAISNLTKGFDIYRMKTEEPVASFEHDVGEPMPTPVLFTHGGRVIIGGSTVGKVNVWDVFLGKMNCLPVPRGNKVLAIAAYCNKSPEPAQQKFLIAAGVFNQNSPSLGILWAAQQLEDGATPSGGADGKGLGTMSPSMGSTGSMSFAVKTLWSAGWVILVAYVLLVMIDEADV